MDADGVKASISVLCVLAGTALGVYAGFQMCASMHTTENVTPAPAERLPGGALKLERALQNAPAAQALPAAPVPPGAVVERRVRVVAQPAATPAPDAPCDCPPVTVDLALIREGEGRRVLAWSPDGRVIGGLDVPIVARLVPVPMPWAAGPSVGFDGSPGVWIDRELGRFEVGIEIHEDRRGQDSSLAGRVRIGWRW
jgi:hypothetical protein